MPIRHPSEDISGWIWEVMELDKISWEESVARERAEKRTEPQEGHLGEPCSKSPSPLRIYKLNSRTESPK